MDNEYKVYVPVLAIFSEEGDILPKVITWEDGRALEIDRVLEVKLPAAPKAGSCGDRYTVKICSKTTHLYHQSQRGV